jgi:hypothetical protein
MQTNINMRALQAKDSKDSLLKGLGCSGRTRSPIEFSLHVNDREAASKLQIWSTVTDDALVSRLVSLVAEVNVVVEAIRSCRSPLQNRCGST